MYVQLFICGFKMGLVKCFGNQNPYLSSIKTHGSESRGQERAKRSPKTKRATNYCVSFTRANVFVI